MFPASKPTPVFHLFPHLNPNLVFFFSSFQTQTYLPSSLHSHGLLPHLGHPLEYLSIACSASIFRIEPTERSQARQSANSSLIFLRSPFLMARASSPISSTSQLKVLLIPLEESFLKYICFISTWYCFRSMLKNGLWVWV